nr:hypothetical protein OG781_01645 [Streptomyces sp. NBC_00830]WTB35632.1 hypothetical protein OG781_44935 [Streptomyces sp. NBC_00830]
MIADWEVTEEAPDRERRVYISLRGKQPITDRDVHVDYYSPGQPYPNTWVHCGCQITVSWMDRRIDTSGQQEQPASPPWPTDQSATPATAGRNPGPTDPLIGPTSADRANATDPADHDLPASCPLLRHAPRSRHACALPRSR